jgi:uncharacterized YccA/Bax inhibitor family protein
MCWLVGDNLMLRDFGPYGIIFINVCVVITVAMLILLSDVGPYVFCLRWLLDDHLLLRDF